MQKMQKMIKKNAKNDLKWFKMQKMQKNAKKWKSHEHVAYRHLFILQIKKNAQTRRFLSPKDLRGMAKIGFRFDRFCFEIFFIALNYFCYLFLFVLFVTFFVVFGLFLLLFVFLAIFCFCLFFLLLLTGMSSQ